MGFEDKGHLVIYEKFVILSCTVGPVRQLSRQRCWLPRLMDQGLGLEFHMVGKNRLQLILLSPSVCPSYTINKKLSSFFFFKEKIGKLVLCSQSSVKGWDCEVTEKSSFLKTERNVIFFFTQQIIKIDNTSLHSRSETVKTTVTGQTECEYLSR